MSEDLAKIKFGNILKRVIKAAELTQTEVADEIGVTPQYLTNIIKGRSPLPGTTFDRIAKFLQVRLPPANYDFLLSAYADYAIDANGQKKATALKDEYGEIYDTNALTVLFAKKFDLLLDTQKIKTMHSIEQMERDNEYRMAQEAGLEPPDQ